MRTLIYRFCANAVQAELGVQSVEMWWDHEKRTRVLVTVPNGPTCSRYVMPVGTVIDIYCDTSNVPFQQVTVISAWDGVGRPPMGYTSSGSPSRVPYIFEYKKNGPACNDGLGGGNCGLKITDVLQVYDKESQTYTITILTEGYNGPIEYSLNNFHDVQDSNVFTGLPAGSQNQDGIWRDSRYTVYARPKR